MAHPAHQPLHADIPWKRGVTLVAAALLMGVEEAWPGPLGTPTAPPPSCTSFAKGKTCLRPPAHPRPEPL